MPNVSAILNAIPCHPRPRITYVREIPLPNALAMKNHVISDFAPFCETKKGNGSNAPLTRQPTDNRFAVGRDVDTSKSLMR